MFGVLLAGLGQRRARNLAPFTVLSCDNVPQNGDVTRQTLLGLAALVSRYLHDWIAGERRLSELDGRLHHPGHDGT